MAAISRLLLSTLLLSFFSFTAAEATQQAATTQTATYPNVILYSASWCGICRRARTYFQNNQIPFTEYDVEKTEKGKQDFVRYGGRGVPLIFVGNQRMDGFSIARFRQLYLPIRQ